MLIDPKVLEQLIRVQMDARCSNPVETYSKMTPDALAPGFFIGSAGLTSAVTLAGEQPQRHHALG